MPKRPLPLCWNGFGRSTPAARVYLSVYGDNAAAIHLYRQAGFSFNGDYDTKGERVMVLDFPETGPAET